MTNKLTDNEYNPLAFPVLNFELGEKLAGIRLHDLYVGMATIGIIAHPEGPAGTWEKAALDAEKAATALLDQRAKRSNQSE